MKTEQGLVRFDRMNESTWCFDMGHQVIPLETGMTFSIQLTDRFQPVEVLELQDRGLAVKRKNQKGNGFCLLDPHRSYLARMFTKSVDAIILRSESELEGDNSSFLGTPQDSETSNLPF